MIEYQIELAGTRCSVTEWNPAAKTVVFALHGWLDNLATFQPLIEFMPDIRLIAFDFPGHGHSEHLPAGAVYHFQDGIFLIDDLARHFELKQVNLLGHSMGGAVSTLYAAAQPNNVAKVALIDSLGPLSASPEDASLLLARAVRQRNLLLEKRKPVYKDFSQALSARALASEIDEDLINPIVERALEKVTGGYTWRADPRLRVASSSRLSPKQLSHILRLIDADMLLLEGRQGYLHNNAELQARKKDFNRLETQVIEGGHHLHLQKPKLCAEQLNRFFKKAGDNSD